MRPLTDERRQQGIWSPLALAMTSVRLAKHEQTKRRERLASKPAHLTGHIWRAASQDSGSLPVAYMTRILAERPSSRRGEHVLTGLVFPDACALRQPGSVVDDQG
jgi:hypothetical protein